MIKEEGVSVDMQMTGNPKGWTALHFAIEARNLEMVKFLVNEMGGKEIAIDLI